MLRLGLGSGGCDPYFEKQQRVESQSHTELCSPSLLCNLERPSPVSTPAPRSQDAQSLGDGGVSGVCSRPLECCHSLHLTSLSTTRLPSLWILRVCKCVSAKFCHDNPSKSFNTDTVSSFSFPGCWKWEELVALSHRCIASPLSRKWSQKPTGCSSLLAYHVWILCALLAFKETACLKAWDKI